MPAKIKVAGRVVRREGEGREKGRRRGGRSKGGGERESRGEVKMNEDRREGEWRKKGREKGYDGGEGEGRGR